MISPPVVLFSTQTADSPTYRLLTGSVSACGLPAEERATKSALTAESYRPTHYPSGHTSTNLQGSLQNRPLICVAFAEEILSKHESIY